MTATDETQIVSGRACKSRSFSSPSELVDLSCYFSWNSKLQTDVTGPSLISVATCVVVVVVVVMVVVVVVMVVVVVVVQESRKRHT